MKRLNILILGLLFLGLFLIPVNTDAKTLGDLRFELNKLKAEKASSESAKNRTQSQINSANQEIKQAGLEAEACEQGIIDAELKIVESEKLIAEKKDQIKELLQFYQVADSENFYLNYIFGAESYTDFIYRYAIVEQLTARNNELIEEMNQLIEKNEAEKIELAKKREQLDTITSKLQNNVSKLGNQLKDLVEESLDISQEIKAMEALINFYVKQGCKNDQDINKCVSIPYDTGFSKPLKSGVVTSEYGMRFHPTQKVYKLHTGIDLGGNKEGTPIYASASGRVAAIIWKSSCGGTQVYMHHNINGIYYTTVYMHMLSVSVKVGDVVTRGGKVGTVGGGSSTKSYDKCTTGPHLHFSTAKGLYFGSAPYGYSSYSTFVNKLVNPRTLVYFPSKGKYW